MMLDEKIIAALLMLSGYALISLLQIAVKKLLKQKPVITARVVFFFTGIALIYYAPLFESWGIKTLWVYIFSAILIFAGIYSLIFKASKKALEMRRGD